MMKSLEVTPSWHSEGHGQEGRHLAVSHAESLWGRTSRTAGDVGVQSDVSVVESAGRSASILHALLGQIQAESKGK